MIIRNIKKESAKTASYWYPKVRIYLIFHWKLVVHYCVDIKNKSLIVGEYKCIYKT